MTSPHGKMKLLCGVAVCALLLLAPGVAHAYIGPGVGISAVGTLFALAGAIVFAIVGFVWYPIRRMIRAVRRKRRTDGSETLSAS